MIRGRREKWSAFATLWVVCAYPLFGLAYDLTKSGGRMHDAIIWLLAGGVWLLLFRILAHNAGWWRMGRVWSKVPAALSVYHVREGTEWLVYALYCSDPRWRWSTRNMIANVFAVPREAVATVTDFGGPSLLVHGDALVVEHILANIALACKNGVRDVVLIQHTATCKALVARNIRFANDDAELLGSQQIVREAMAKVIKAIPQAKVWGAVMVRSKTNGVWSRLWAWLFGQGVKFKWIDSRYPSGLT